MPRRACIAPGWTCQKGTKVKTAFTISREARYGAAVLTLLTAAAVAAAPAQDPRPRPVAATAQARATIRIVAGVQLHFGEEEHNRDGFVARDSTIRSLGIEQPAKLFEFQ